jgi:hypothetical protein
MPSNTIERYRYCEGLATGKYLMLACYSVAGNHLESLMNATNCLVRTASN